MHRALFNSGNHGASQRRWRLVLLGWKLDKPGKSVIMALENEEWASRVPPGKLANALVPWMSPLAAGWERAVEFCKPEDAHGPRAKD